MISNRILFGVIVLLLAGENAGAATLNVGQGQTYSTIQSALDASETGDVISVSEGIYYENVLIRKNGVLIIGKNKERTIIDGQKTGSVIRIETDDVTVSGFTIRNNGGSGKGDGGIGMYNANNNMIANSIFENNTAGISIDTSSNNNIIAGNIIRYNYREGIKLFSCLDNKIYGNQIQKNQVGIYADSSRGGKIYSNNFIDNTLDQAYDNSGMNSWDDGKSGNYWSTYKAGGVFNIKGGANARDNYSLSGAVEIKEVPITIPTPLNAQGTTQGEAKKSTPGFELLLAIAVIGILGFMDRKE